MIYLPTHLDGVHLSVPGVHPSLSIAPLLESESSYCVSFYPIIVPLSVPKSTYMILWLRVCFSSGIDIFLNSTDLSVVPHFVIVYEYGIPRLGILFSSMLSSKVGSHPTRFTMPYITMG